MAIAIECVAIAIECVAIAIASMGHGSGAAARSTGNPKVLGSKPVWRLGFFPRVSLILSRFDGYLTLVGVK